MKYIIAAVLSAILLQLSPAHINNSAVKPVANKNTGQRHNVGSLTVKVSETTSQVAATERVEPETRPLSDKEQLMQQAGIPQSDWQAVDYIVSHESSWNAAAVNASSGATGLCQALPAAKMASAGTDYMSNPVTQLRWCHDYAMTRYSGWWSAFAFWKLNRWW